MERSEPTLVPEWLRCSGSVTGVGSSAHHFASSSDVTSSMLSPRNRAFKIINDKDSQRLSVLDRSNSSNSRRSSISNGSTKHPYSSFTRSHRDKNRDKEKERSAVRDLWDHDIMHPFTSILSSRVENTLRRSQSMVSRNPGDSLSRRAGELKKSDGLNQSSGNGVLSGGSSVRGMQRADFEKDFPSLGTEEKQFGSGIGRVSSPGLSTAVQSLTIGNSGLNGCEGWTSALAEVPPVIGSSITGTMSIQQNVIANSSSGAASSMVGLNMAESLSQAPARVHTTFQLPDKTQMLEELAVKQSRQLIPMTPSTPKPLVLNSSDKLKQPKTTVRASESIVPASQSLRGGPSSSNSAPRTAHSGKFLVLKPVRENGISSTFTAKEVSSTTNNNSISKVTNTQVPVAPRAPPVNLATPRSTVEKRASLSQAKSRIDFFNLMRKKATLNSSCIVSDSDSVLSPTMKNSGGVIEEVGDALVNPLVTENGKVTSNGDSHEGGGHRFSSNVEKNLCLNGTVYPDEEEAAFLRSLGWEEENGGEDEGLTEEEINAFYQEYMKLRPSLKVAKNLNVV